MESAEAFGIGHTVSMTPLHAVKEVREEMKNRVSFICMPAFHTEMTREDFKRNFLSEMKQFEAEGVKVVKFWCPPRLSDAKINQSRGPLLLNSELMISLMEEAAALGMSFMVHVADPDTWFATKYQDQRRYGSKTSHIEAFREVLDRFNVPVIAAHMGGSPEDLDLLSELLEAHGNLHLDTSATRWMVRELSKHDEKKIVAFMQRWKHRIAFGSDIVTVEEGFAAKTERELYFSRYWALRTLLETDYKGESPIADPDLINEGATQQVPILKGKALPRDVLQSIYFETAKKFFKI
jgi:predicted TIM-barrel fold metal-dependent hydrolase